MSIVQQIYQFLHRATTPSGERSSSVSPGYWNYLARRAALSACHDIEGNILDVGCGDGLFLIQLAKQNPKAGIWAVDINADFISQAQERVRRENITTVHFSRQDATALEFGDTLFDMVVCTNLFMVMDSLATVRRALYAIDRVCRRGACVFFDFRNARNPVLRLKYKLAPLYDKTLKPGQYLSTYRPADIYDALRDAHMVVSLEKCYGQVFFKKFAPVIIVKARKI
ncbi:MAG: class I SAM-dependent methyltransferase [Candidatus Omnitrophota bacterium]